MQEKAGGQRYKSVQTWQEAFRKDKTQKMSKVLSPHARRSNMPFLTRNY